MISLTGRAARLAALGDPVRLRIVDELLLSDRAPVELRRRLGIESNLLAHHLDVLEQGGLVSRSRSSGDGRRRYLHLVPGSLDGLLPTGGGAPERALFVCTQNSARSQLAAALWRDMTHGEADSAGTHPAGQVHAGAVAAAGRAGLDLSGAAPRSYDGPEADTLMVTVCDQAHEELDPSDDWLHWSIADPVVDGRPVSFDAVVAELRNRIAGFLTGTGGTR